MNIALNGHKSANYVEHKVHIALPKLGEKLFAICLLIMNQPHHCVKPHHKCQSSICM